MRVSNPVDTFVLDTSLLLGGQEPPRGQWWTTPEAAAEVTPGGRDARRFDGWQAAGLQVRSASPDAMRRVEETAMRAGNLGRLSAADLSLLALAAERGACLLTDDYTMQDVALRMDIAFQGVNQPGIEGTKTFKPRCKGCGRWYDAMPKREECIVCGSAVALKPN